MSRPDRSDHYFPRGRKYPVDPTRSPGPFAYPGTHAAPEHHGSARGEFHTGQYEIVYDEAMTTCGQPCVFKDRVKQISAQEGAALTFMPKFDEGEGSSCHIHLSLRGTDSSAVLADEAADDGLGGVRLPDAARGGGFGPAGLTERVAALGGQPCAGPRSGADGKSRRCRPPGVVHDRGHERRSDPCTARRRPGDGPYRFPLLPRRPAGHQGGRRGRRRRGGGRPGPAAAPRRVPAGHPDAQAGRARGHPAARRARRRRPAARRRGHHLRPRRVRVRRAARRRVRLPAQGRGPHAAGRGGAGGGRRRRADLPLGHRPAAAQPRQPQPTATPAAGPRPAAAVPPSRSPTASSTSYSRSRSAAPTRRSPPSCIVSLSTVKTHLGSVQLKLGARNRVEIAAWAWESGHAGRG